MKKYAVLWPLLFFLTLFHRLLTFCCCFFTPVRFYFFSQVLSFSLFVWLLHMQPQVFNISHGSFSEGAPQSQYNITFYNSVGFKTMKLGTPAFHDIMTHGNSSTLLPLIKCRYISLVYDFLRLNQIKQIKPITNTAVKCGGYSLLGGAAAQIHLHSLLGQHTILWQFIAFFFF